MLLRYHEVALSNPQARFTDRSCLVPNLDLGDYVCTAVIDWVEVVLWLTRSTSYQHLRDMLDKSTGQRPWVEPVKGDPGDGQVRFAIRFQEPKLRLIDQALEAIRIDYGFEMLPIVRRIEISIDFKTPSSDARARMVGVLVRHLFPNRDILSNHRDRPRYSWGPEADETGFVLAKGVRGLAKNDELLMSDGLDRPAPTDATSYFGEDGGPVMWRVMVKERDKQNVGAGTALILPWDQKRARIEVTLSRSEIAALGVDFLDDLRSFNFVKLQGHYFRFMLPTFQTTFHNHHPEVSRLFERRRRRKFMNAGVIGLEASDNALARARARSRPAMLHVLKSRGIVTKRLARHGTGTSGTLIAFPEMNKRVETALRHLMEKQNA